MAPRRRRTRCKGTLDVRKLEPTFCSSCKTTFGQTSGSPVDVSIQHTHNQSLNRSINQSTNQSIAQSINQLIHRSINQPINQSINQSLNQPINRPHPPGPRTERPDQAAASEPRSRARRGAQPAGAARHAPAQRPIHSHALVFGGVHPRRRGQGVGQRPGGNEAALERCVG